ncbi:hypothetical protein D3C76_673130 [compost metagenome]
MLVGQVGSQCELTYLLTLSLGKSPTGDRGTEERLTVRLCSVGDGLNQPYSRLPTAFLMRLAAICQING